MNRERNLLVVSGPSGAGKDTVVSRLIEAHKGEIELSVSATTRQPRPDEAHGQMYYYLTREEFMRRVEDGEFAEYAEYAGNLYGTLKSEIDKRIDNGIVCVLVIEVNGAANIKSKYPECTTVFVEPPGAEEHERRLRSRGTESEEDIARRLEIAAEEMKMAESYDYRVVNDIARVCADGVYAILQKRRSE